MSTNDALDDDDHLASLSIKQLALEFGRRFPRSRFLVTPSRWTADHLRFLRCTFLAASSQTPSNAENTDDQQFKQALWALKNAYPPAEATKCARTLASNKGVLILEQEHTMRTLLGCWSFELLKQPLQLRFRSREFHVSRRVYVRSGCGQRTISVATYDYSFITSTRICDDVLDLPLQCRRYEPKDPHRDPFIVATLIAQAQVTQRIDFTADPKRFADSNPSQMAFVLLRGMEGNDSKDMHIYSADVSRAFLRRFNHPGRTPGSSDETSLDITHKRLPFKPYESFNSRLLDILRTTSIETKGEQLTKDITHDTKRCRGDEDVSQVTKRLRKSEE